MNISPLEIYLITRMDDIKYCIGTVAVTAAISAFVLSAFILVLKIESSKKDEETSKILKRYRNPLVSIAILSTILALAMPDTKQAVAMFTIPQVVNSRIVQEDVPQAVRDLWKKVTKEENNND